MGYSQVRQPRISARAETIGLIVGLVITVILLVAMS